MDSIIFDLDGTIWDPIDTVLEAWNSRIRESEQIQKELTRTDLEGIMGLQMDEVGRILFPEADEDHQRRLIQECGDMEKDFLRDKGGRLFHNAERVVNQLSKEYKLFIVSNCQDGYIESFYAYHKLENYLSDFENPGRTGLSKGENIQLIIDRNYLSHPVYVGDTEGDYKASRHAGIPFVYAAYGFGQVPQYDEVIDRFDDLLTLYGK
ncbi:HAD family hydrolase [Halobacillus yeomjeoni]|uniref:HAD family hydrolase n=1 Tax=Halobacillus yeomjeoni TaxID=311194 RepID=A0A931HT81_9BACI|nr:HAD family hydrolase [Halobacillus yeomjeoni]MBH0229352.1 HAD family hydrolase [Halobacillus yeomjeoni]